jgi:hypothetical protein
MEEDDYFRRNLPPSYCLGSESNSRINECSKGYPELYQNLNSLEENECNRKIENNERKKLVKKPV